MVKVKVLMLLPSMGRNGILTGTPAHVVKLTKGLKRKGASVRVFECRARGKHTQVNITASLWSVWWKLFIELYNNRPDVIHAHTHEAALIGIFIAKFFNIKVIYECHGIPRVSTNKKLRSALLVSLERYAILFSDGLISQAKKMGARMKSIRNSSVPSLTLYPGLNVSEFSEVTYENESHQNSKKVVYVGTSQKYQGLDLLSKSQAYTAKRTYFELYLSDGTADEIIASQTFDMSRTKIVNLVNSQVLPKLLSSADILVHARPDVPDNWNVQSKLGLYLASGTPIVTTAVGDYVDILSGYGGAVMVRPDGAEIGKAIENALADKKVIDYASEFGAEHAKGFFDLNENVSKLYCFYERIIND